MKTNINTPATVTIREQYAECAVSTTLARELQYLGAYVSGVIEATEKWLAGEEQTEPQEEQTEPTRKYTVVVGHGYDANGAPLNLTAEQARETVERVLLVCSRLGGWTLSECWGGWVHNGETFREPSIRVEFASDCGREYAERVALCLRDTFEQNSVYFEVGEPSISFI